MQDIVIEKIIDRKAVLKELINIWRESVLATHDFLNIDNINEIEPYVVKGLQELEIVCCIKEENNILGFMAIQKEKLEMLFVHPKSIGKGFGKRLLNYAKTNLDIKFVDVNEENKKACEFYVRQGFEVFDRSTHDDMGNPFPILHMKIS